MQITITESAERWQEARLSRFTASEIHKLMGSSRNGNSLSKTAETFVYEKAAEILTGQKKQIFGQALDWGIEHESHAFSKFSRITFEEFTYYGGETYVFIPYGDFSGYSPDGLSKDAILEIKCPYNSAIHLKNFEIYKVAYDYCGADTPSEIFGPNSRYSVETINKKLVPWLTKFPDKALYAGASVEEFITFIEDGGGTVYLPKEKNNAES